MQIIIEGLALAAFERQRAAAMDPLLKDLFYLVIRDEARHVTFGVNYLEEFVQTLSDEEKEERADFAYEACVVMRNRFGSDNVMKQFGWNVEEAQEVLNQSENAKLFNNLLFAKIMPNLKRIGLVTEKTQEKYAEMDILQFQDLEDHGNIDWDELSQPLRLLFKNSLSMKIKVVDNPPVDPREFDLPEGFNERHIEDVVEIFNTPLIGHYNWDYTDADTRIKKLYELGKKLNWDGSIDLDWSKAIKKGEAPVKAELVSTNGGASSRPTRRRTSRVSMDTIKPGGSVNFFMESKEHF